MARSVTVAKNLRSAQTDAERKLWFRLRDRRLAGLKFRRQVPINRYVVDFCCEASRLIVEVDGGQHGSQDETNRTVSLEAKGYLVVRFWNNDVLQNIDGVIESILTTLDKSTSLPPHPNPLPNEEREQI